MSATGVRVSCPMSKSSPSGNKIGVVFSMCFLSHFFTVHDQNARATLAEPAAVELKVEDDSVLTRFELRACPSRPPQIEQIVQKHRSAPTDSKFAFARSATGRTARPDSPD